MYEVSFKLIKAKEVDKPYLLALRTLTMTEHLEKAGLYLTPEEHEFRLNHNFAHSYLIDLSGKIVGAIQYEESKGRLNIIQLQMHPEFQGMGHGGKVMQQIIESSNSNLITLSVLKNNPAKNLYLRLGFEVAGEDKHEFFMELRINNEQRNAP